jgi:hypothetical protein
MQLVRQVHSNRPTRLTKGGAKTRGHVSAISPTRKNLCFWKAGQRTSIAGLLLTGRKYRFVSVLIVLKESIYTDEDHPKTDKAFGCLDFCHHCLSSASWKLPQVKSVGYALFVLLFALSCYLLA